MPGKQYDGLFACLMNGYVPVPGLPFIRWMVNGGIEGDNENTTSSKGGSFVLEWCGLGMHGNITPIHQNESASAASFSTDVLQCRFPYGTSGCKISKPKVRRSNREVQVQTEIVLCLLRACVDAGTMMGWFCLLLAR